MQVIMRTYFRGMVDRGKCAKPFFFYNKATIMAWNLLKVHSKSMSNVRNPFTESFLNYFKGTVMQII